MSFFAFNRNTGKIKIEVIFNSVNSIGHEGPYKKSVDNKGQRLQVRYVQQTCL